MPNGRKGMLGAFAASLSLAAAGLAAAPVYAQSGSGTGEPDEPIYCYSEAGKYWYPCCNRWDPCGTQFWVDSALPPARPAEPAEPPKD